MSVGRYEDFSMENQWELVGNTIFDVVKSKRFRNNVKLCLLTLHYRSVTNYHPHHSCACALCRVMSHGPECVYREYRDMEHGWVLYCTVLYCNVLYCTVL